MANIQWNATYKFKITDAQIGYETRKIAVFASNRADAIDEVKRHTASFKHTNHFSIDHIARNDGKHH